MASVKANESVLVVCPVHSEGERVGRAIREELKLQRLLGVEDRQLERLISLHLTESERTDPNSYSQGDVIVFHQNAAGHKKGERIRLQEIPDAELLSHAKHFQVFHCDEITVSEGELLRITANGKTLDGHRLNNGAMCRVEGFTDTGNLRLANGWEVAADWGMFAPGYVTTSHSSQGRTVDRVMIAEPSASFAAASAEQFYVSASRGRKGMRIYTDDRSALTAAIHRSAQRPSALELVDGLRDDVELRRLHEARQAIVAAQRETRAQERNWEIVYER